MRAEGPRHGIILDNAGLQPAWFSDFATQPCGLGYYESGRWPYYESGRWPSNAIAAKTIRRQTIRRQNHHSQQPKK